MSGLFENELVSNKQKEFVADYNTEIDMYKCSETLFNIPIISGQPRISWPHPAEFPFPKSD